MKRWLTGVIVFWAAFLPDTSTYSETIIIKDAPGILPVTIDIPADWTKTQTVKKNGIIVNLAHGESRMEIRSLTSKDMSMDYIINSRAARLNANYSYVNLLLEKADESGNLRKRTVFWLMKQNNQTWFEKTVILYFENNIVILSCIAPEIEYRNNRVIFENAVLSLKYDAGDSAKEKPANGGTGEKTTKDDGSGNLIRDIGDTRENKANKLDKLK